VSHPSTRLPVDRSVDCWPQFETHPVANGQDCPARM